jgi:hypothetical protein
MTQEALMENVITVHDLNLALTQRIGTAEPLFMAQRYYAEACYYHACESESSGGAYVATMKIIAMLTGVAFDDVLAIVREEWRKGAYVIEVWDDDVRCHAEAWGISREEAEKSHPRPIIGGR